MNENMNKRSILISILFLTALICSGFSTKSYLGVNPAYAEQGEQAYRKDSKDGIRDLFNSFNENMIAYERHETNDPTDVLNLLKCPERISKENQNSFLLKKAKRLFLVLEYMIFDYRSDLPDVTPGMTKATVTLRTEEMDHIAFKVVKDDGKWKFAPETLENQNLHALYQKIDAKIKKFTSLGADGETFDLTLMSPYRTMLTLRNGVLGRYGHNLKDAASTLDLSEIDPSLRDRMGKILAVELYRIIHFQSPLNLEQLSANPQTETIPIFKVEPGYGVITMHVVADSDGVKAWKFTPKTLEVARESYDQNMQLIKDEGENPFIGSDLPMFILIDDIVLRDLPLLDKDVAGIDLWKILLFAILMITTPILAKVIKLVSRFILKHLRNRSGKVLERVSDKNLTVPLNFILLGYLWASGLAVMIIRAESAGHILRSGFTSLDHSAANLRWTVS